MTRAVYITGLGLSTPLGRTLDQTWLGLLASRYITDHALVPDLSKGPGLRVDRLARTVARQALDDSRWPQSKLRDAALVVGTSRGPVEGWLAGNSDDSQCNDNALAGTSFGWGMSRIAARLAAELRLEGGPVLTLSTACASGLHALIRAAMLIQNGEAERAVVVGADSSLHPMFLQSFRRLGVLPPAGHGCRPFDQQRAGFLASEAAAAVCLEAGGENDSKKDSLRIDRFALAGDAHHLTGADPAGTTLARVLRHIINAQPIDLIHAHGTGTQINDPIELAAIESGLSGSEKPPHLYSHKGALGHSLGAAGLVSIVISCLSHHHGIIPPNVQTKSPLMTTRATIDPSPVQRPIRRSLAIAAGFGGAIGAVSVIGST